jgi:CRISPR/Cas system-associated exonuclease Cas4 (RecB family)
MIKLSRSKIELSIDCPRCFWLDMRHKVSRPPGFPFTLNNAIDFLLKREFDEHREKGTAHAIIKENKLDAIPYNCPQIDAWRHNFTGVQIEHAPTGFLVYGAVDDIWINPKKELIVVDYKATGSQEHKIYDSYKRQMEIYQWLLSHQGMPVSKTGYFLFARANKDKGFKDHKLSFDVFLEALAGDYSWVEGAIKEAKRIYDLPAAPKATDDCEYCPYVTRRNSVAP